MTALARFEAVVDASGVAPGIEDMLPAGVRARQPAVRTLLLGMMITLADGRPAHLARVHQALAGLPGDGQRRLGVLADWKDGPHRLTYRQTEYTFGLVTRALGKDEPDGLPSPALQRVCDDLLEASVPEEFKDASRSLAVDWSDLETFSRPRRTEPATAPIPRPPGDTAGTTCRTTRTSCSTATTSRPESWCQTSTAAPSPSSPAARPPRPAATTLCPRLPRS